MEGGVGPEFYQFDILYQEPMGDKDVENQGNALRRAFDRLRLISQNETAPFIKSMLCSKLTDATLETGYA